MATQTEARGAVYRIPQTSGTRKVIRCTAVAQLRLTALPLALLVLGLPMISASAQELRNYESYGAIYHDVGNERSAGQSVQPVAPRIERTDPDTFVSRTTSTLLAVPGIPTARAPTESMPTREELEASRRARVHAHAAKLAGHELVELVVDLQDIPFEEITELRSMQEDARRRLLDRREAEIHAAQLDFADHARWYGAVVLDSLWLLNRLRINVPASVVKEVLDHADVRAVHPAWAKVRPDYDGLQIKLDTNLLDLYAGNIKGETGGHVFNANFGGDDIKIAVIEAEEGPTGWPIFALDAPNRINTAHPGWEDWTNGPSRIRWNLDCLGSCVSSAPAEAPTHGTIVAWTAAGAIDQGQDPNITDGWEQLRRSGVAPEASILYFRVDTPGDVASALLAAALAGADVANLSITLTQGDGCDPTCAFYGDCGGLNAMIKTVTDAGMLVVISAGNDNNEPGLKYPDDVNCNVSYPGQRPEAITVGGIGAVPGEPDPYQFEPIGNYSGRGFVTTFVGGSHFAVDEMSVVSITAPGVVELYFAEQDEYSDTSASFAGWVAPVDGTSFAAPVISGGAGLLRELMGPVTHDARMLKALVLVMGDGTGARSAYGGREQGVSEVYGTGKFRAHNLQLLPQPAGYLLTQYHLEEGWVASQPIPPSGGPLPSGVSQIKWAAYIDQSDLGQVPFLFFSLVDTCLGYGLLAYDWYFGLEKYISLEVASISGICPELRVYGYSVPAGGVQVYNAAYYHGGSTSEH